MTNDEALPRRSFVLDAKMRVTESDCAELPCGETMSERTWLGETMIEAVRAATKGGRGERRLASHSMTATHWLISAELCEGPTWRARVDAVDVTSVVEGDRGVLLPRLVHALQNVRFALGSLVDGIAAERPAGDDLDRYLEHLRATTDRLSGLVGALAACNVAPKPTPTRVSVDALIARALETVPPRNRPGVEMLDRGMEVEVDVEGVARAIASIVAAGHGDAGTSLVVARAEESSRAFARFSVECKIRPSDDRPIAATWDLVGGHDPAVQARLASARAWIVASGGDVGASRSDDGRLCLSFRLPLVNDASRAPLPSARSARAR